MRFSAVSAALAIGGVMLLSACNKTPEPSTITQTAPTSSQPAVTAAAAAEQGDPLAVLTASPNPIDVCGQDKKVTSVTIDWDLSKTKTRNYHVWVEAPTQPKKLWFSSFKPTGSKQTGNWVRADTRVTVTTPDGKLVASTLITASACNR